MKEPWIFGKFKQNNFGILRVIYLLCRTKESEEKMVTTITIHRNIIFFISCQWLKPQKEQFTVMCVAFFSQNGKTPLVNLHY